MLESDYQARLIKKIKSQIPGSVVIKNDPNYRQGFPDLLVLFMDKWAVLEVKASEDAAFQPNQEWYIDFLGEMSFAAVIYPSNELEVLRELQRALEPCRHSRFSKR